MIHGRHEQGGSTITMQLSRAFFLTPQGLAATGPRAFGYDFDYKSGLSGRNPGRGLR